MIFKNEAGEVVTPQKGDYVLAGDIDGEEMHSRVREAFISAGCGWGGTGAIYGKSYKHLDAIKWTTSDQIQWDTSIEGRRIIPVEQTLFEAAKDAPDGTRFDVAGSIYVKRAGKLEWEGNKSLIADLTDLQRIDFEIVQSGPKKRDCDVSDIVFEDKIKIPQDMIDDCVDAFGLIARLSMWEGAQIGKPGYVLSYIENIEPLKIDPIYSKYVLPSSVTFETPEQCLSAWKAECQEMFK